MFSMPDNLEHLRGGCRKWIEDAARLDWRPADGAEGRDSLFTMVLRAIAIKQFESVRTALDLENRTEGFAAVPQLRAMCEELIWVSYLSKLDRSTASSIVADLASTGIYQTFLAQQTYPIANSSFAEE
jgi:hypothetical protein